MLKVIDSIPLPFYIVLSLFLGLAPFFPEPHLVEKIKMLQAGELSRMIDIFDLVLHATPWILLIIKISLMIKPKSQSTSMESES
ncbi:MAG: RND transporter [Gammaproteobacteria bacterium]|nr:RND transporter [Gammaproteobacteria bacterium]